MIAPASDTAAYDAMCEATHPSDSFVDTDLVRAASPLSKLTPALGRSDEPDTTVIDLSPRTLDRETARAQLIELFYASLPEAEIGRAINLLNTVMP